MAITVGLSRRIALAAIMALVGVSVTGCHFPITGWPIEPAGSVHPIATSGGEFQQYGGAPYFHRGIDILADPAPSGPFVRTTRAGVPILTLTGMSSQYNRVQVDNPDGSIYIYDHLDYTSIQQAVRDADDANASLPGNSQVAQVTVWWDGESHHLHYETVDSAGGEILYEDPVWSLTPRGDTTDPVIDDLFFTPNGSNTGGLSAINEFPGLDVYGIVDILALAYDTQFGAAPTGVMTLQYKVTNTNGVTVRTGPKIDFTRIPASDPNVSIIYRTSAPFESKSKYWPGGTEVFYYVVTNMDSSGSFSEDSGWDTTAHPNGIYFVEVRAWDASFNSVARSELVIISN